MSLALLAAFLVRCSGATPDSQATPEVLRYSASAASSETHVTLRRQAGRVIVIDDSTHRIVASGDAGRIKRVSVRGVDGDHNDTLTVDFSGGLSLPGGIDFDGGTAGFDTLRIVGNERADVHDLPINRSDGVVQVGATEIRYRNLEPVTDTVPSGLFVFTLPAGTGGATLQDNGSSMAQIVSTNSSFETVTFANKSALSIEMGGSADTVTLAANVWPDLPGIPVTVSGSGSGNTLIVDLTGITLPNLPVTNSSGNLSGTWTATNRPTLTFSGVQSLNPADVSVTNSGPASGTIGSTLTYTIQVNNAGPNWATGVTVTDALPAGAAFVSVASSQGSCSGTATVTCPLGQMAPGGSATISLVVQANSGTSISDTASVAVMTTDTNSANNTSTWVAPLSPAVPTPALSTLGLALLAALLAAAGATFLSSGGGARTSASGK